MESGQQAVRGRPRQTGLSFHNWPDACNTPDLAAGTTIDFRSCPASATVYWSRTHPSSPTTTKTVATFWKSIAVTIPARPRFAPSAHKNRLARGRRTRGRAVPSPPRAHADAPLHETAEQDQDKFLRLRSWPKHLAKMLTSSGSVKTARNAVFTELSTVGVTRG